MLIVMLNDIIKKRHRARFAMNRNSQACLKDKLKLLQPIIGCFRDLISSIISLYMKIWVTFTSSLNRHGVLCD